MRSIRPSIPLAAALVLAVSSTAASEPAREGALLIVERVVHFAGPEGEDALLVPSTYTVGHREGNVLLLRPERGDSIAIQAAEGQHIEELSEAEVAVDESGGDEVRLLLLLPAGRTLEATGTYSGFVERAARSRTTLGRSQIAAIRTSARVVVREPKAGSRTPVSRPRRATSPTRLPSKAVDAKRPLARRLPARIGWRRPAGAPPRVLSVRAPSSVPSGNLVHVSVVAEDDVEIAGYIVTLGSSSARHVAAPSKKRTGSTESLTAAGDGPWPLTVLAFDKTGLRSSPYRTNVTQAPPPPPSDTSSYPYPNVVAISPAEAGPASGVLTLTGVDLRPEAFRVRLGAAQLAIISATPTQVEARLPESLAVGDLFVSHGAPGNEYLFRAGYRVVGVPVITGITPTSFALGDEITLTGTDLDQAFALEPPCEPNCSNGKHVKLGTDDSRYGDNLLGLAPLGWAGGQWHYWEGNAEGTLLEMTPVTVGKYWLDTFYNGDRFASHDPQPLSSQLRLLGPPDGLFSVASPHVQFTGLAPLQLFSVYSDRFASCGKRAPFQILFPEEPNYAHADTRGFYSANQFTVGAPQASFGAHVLGAVSGDRTGRSGRFALPYDIEVPAARFRLQYGNQSVTSQDFAVTRAPRFLPVSENLWQGGKFAIELNRQYDLVGFDLKPSHIQGLRYEFRLGSLDAAAQQVFALDYQLLEHNDGKISFRVDQTAPLPGNASTSSLFQPSAQYPRHLRIVAIHEGCERVVFEVPYYLDASS